MLSWYREQLKWHGFLTATTLLARVLWARAVAHLSNKLQSEKVVCPCCGWAGRRFYDYIEVGCTMRCVECPRCNSHPRHRLFALWLVNEYALQTKEGIALVFAPERALERTWASARGLKIIKTDIEPARGVDLLADIQRLPFAADSFDLIWCQHVLTQIPDDRAGIAEMQRVLRAGSGELIVSAAHVPGIQTHEFGHANKNHLGFWRMYGDDFEQRLMEGGLIARPVGFAMSAKERALYGINSDERFFICTKASSA